ncbi:MAG: ThiF family adenylyltransferase [Planctomycetes bacterium]|nr:ThiF family adenylyltransferase [Planctomycetota bacterium]
MSEAQRHLRQIALPWCGPQGQARLKSSHALVVGCGALGSASIEWLARAGVGRLTLVDRDVVEWSNLQRQQLFSERDARSGAPKAEAASRRVKEIDSGIRVDACVEHLDAHNAAELARGADVIVDGLDNVATRFILNDLSVRDGIPYIYAAAVAMEGLSLAVVPRDLGAAGDENFAARGACLRCVYPDLPAPGELPTCDRAGVLGPLVGMVGSFAASQALFILAGRPDLLERKLWSVDLADHRRASIAVSIDGQCECCGKRKFPFLEPADDNPRVAHLCGRGAIQVLPSRRGRGAMDLAVLQSQLKIHGQFAMQGGRLQGQLKDLPGTGGEPVELTVFADGRAIVGQCSDEVVAQSIYDRFIGG